jgi:3-phenylpropionate/trans-cinnamate dioxygenase ferredoxin reductase subunit
VTILDMLSGPLVRVVGPVVAPLVADLHRQHGVHLHFDVSATKGPDGSLALSDGTVVPAGTVLEAAGVTPDVGWLAESGIEIGNGVVCDARGRTSVDGVYAVGDVARWAGVRTENWSSAVDQADRVAARVLGQPDPPATVPYWWSDQYDVKIQCLGRPHNDDDVDLLKWGPHQRTLAVYSRAGRVTGVLGFSAAPAVMRTRDAIGCRQQVTDVLADLPGH